MHSFLRFESIEFALRYFQLEIYFFIYEILSMFAFINLIFRSLHCTKNEVFHCGFGHIYGRNP